MSRAKAKGTAAESVVAAFLRRTWPWVERRAASGSQDKGDIAGVPRLVVEVKAHTTPRHASWLKEAEAERVNADADYAIVVHKPRGKGEVSVGKWHVIMTLEEFVAMYSRCEPRPSTNGRPTRG